MTETTTRTPAPAPDQVEVSVAEQALSQQIGNMALVLAKTQEGAARAQAQARAQIAELHKRIQALEQQLVSKGVERKAVDAVIAAAKGKPNGKEAPNGP